MSEPSRRLFLTLSASALATGRAAVAQQATPPSVITTPPRAWGRDAPPAIYPDPDVIVVDPAFLPLRGGNVAIHRITTGFQWAEGPAWCSEPYGDRLSEGHPDDAGGPSNPAGAFNPRIGAEDVVPVSKRELPTNVYRWDPSGRLDAVITEDKLADPNGICFSPDYKTLYVISTGKGPGDSGPGGTRSIYAFEVNGTTVGGQRVFTDMKVDGVQCGPDGMRADKFGNLWCGSNAPLGYAGVLVFSAEGKLLGRIRLPEVCANLAFGGPKHDTLFMTAAQSLYMLRVGVQGAAPG
jgi:gluconolactonase